MLDQVIPTPRLLEIDHADVAGRPERVWLLLRHGELASSALIRALFALRTLPERLAGKPVSSSVRIDQLRSSAKHPGFQLLLEEPPRELVVGAIGKVWRVELPFVHVAHAADYAAFREPGYIKVAWAIRVLPRGEQDCRVEFELRVDATDDSSWHKFQRYFRLIGPTSHFIRRSLLRSLARELGTPDAKENERRLPGDELLADTSAQVTHGITVEAPPESIWPYLLQMLPATPAGDDGFEVLSVDEPRLLMLGGLYDPESEAQLAFAAPRPERFWQVTWAFVLEPLDERSTRLHVRARAAFAAGERLHATWIRPVHHFIQSAMLRHLKHHAEGLSKDHLRRDVVGGLRGIAVALDALLSTVLRRARNHAGPHERLRFARPRVMS